MRPDIANMGRSLIQIYFKRSIETLNAWLTVFFREVGRKVSPEVGVEVLKRVEEVWNVWGDQ